MDAVVSALWVYPGQIVQGHPPRAERRRAARAAGRPPLDGRRRARQVRHAADEPRLALVEVALEGDSLVLRAPGQGELRLPGLTRGHEAGQRRRVQVWRDEVDAIDCGPEAARWIGAWMGGSFSLVHMPDDVLRPVKPAYALPSDIVGFADGFPLLIASTSSLDDLNARMDTPLPMDRFRPSVVVTGCAPWAEDEWRRIRVGGLDVRVAKPCDRCVVTTIDQQTAERGVEPLRTLARFRRRDNDVLFAQNAIPDSRGWIAVGDLVEVLERA